MDSIMRSICCSSEVIPALDLGVEVVDSMPESVIAPPDEVSSIELTTELSIMELSIMELSIELIMDSGPLVLPGMLTAELALDVGELLMPLLVVSHEQPAKIARQAHKTAAKINTLFIYIFLSLFRRLFSPPGH